MKKSQEEQKHFTQRRKALEGAKETKQLFFAILCALASLREIVYFFTVSAVVGITSCYQFSPRQRATESLTATDYLCRPCRGSSLVLPPLPMAAAMGHPAERDRRYAACLHSLYFRMVCFGQPNESPRI